ncbi:hypothetical protein BHQ15_12300 [Mycolicibacillus koreensis]|nr:hypothetical protein BHQ15_12300 [Mycolicibacillus koreensis]
MGAPTGADLSAFTGRDVSGEQATAVISVVTAMANAYTRGRGFTAGEPNNEVRAVILSAAARLVADPSQITDEQVMGPFRVSYNTDHAVAWSTAELAVLNRYRERAR